MTGVDVVWRWTVGLLVTAVVMGLAAIIIISDQHAQDRCRATGGLVVDVQHGDSWVCTDRDGRLR